MASQFERGISDRRQPAGIDRREFLGAAAGGLTALTLGAASAPERRRPNVIFAFSDEHRYQSTSFTEMPELKTPHLAELAAQGVTFTHCISNYPVCSPYRAMVLTGRWPFEEGVTDNDLPLSSDSVTLGKVFQQAGYRTGYIGKWHLGGLRAEPFGFDESLIWTETNTHWDASRYHPKEGEPVKPKGYNATLMTDQAIAFIEEQARGTAPFLLALSWNPPHSSFIDASDAYKALYPEGSLSYRPNVDLSRAAAPGANARIWDQNSWPYYQGYHAHVSAIDAELGRLMATLETLGIARDTIVVYSSDHGSMLGSHGEGGKRQPYDESIRVPFLVRAPGRVPAGAKVSELFGAIDIMPTLCGLAELPVPKVCAGQDFSEAARGGRGPSTESQFIMHISKKNASGGENHPAPLFRGVRTKRYTYAAQPDKAWCLFDNEADPYQMKNLIGDASHAEVRRGLEAMTRAWLDKARDPFVLPA